jgi:hypothetical protein
MILRYNGDRLPKVLYKEMQRINFIGDLIFNLEKKELLIYIL